MEKTSKHTLLDSASQEIWTIVNSLLLAVISVF